MFIVENNAYESKGSPEVIPCATVGEALEIAERIYEVFSTPKRIDIKQPIFGGSCHEEWVRIVEESEVTR